MTAESLVENENKDQIMKYLEMGEEVLASIAKTSDAIIQTGIVNTELYNIDQRMAKKGWEREDTLFTLQLALAQETSDETLLLSVLDVIKKKRKYEKICIEKYV